MTTKRHLVLARNTRINEQGLTTGAGHRKFKPGKSAMYIKDPAEAREIEQHYGKNGTNDVLVFDDDKVARHVKNERGEIHNYFFGAMSLHPQGGNEPVKVKTADGYTIVSRLVAEEEGLPIIPQKQRVHVRRNNGI